MTSGRYAPLSMALLAALGSVAAACAWMVDNSSIERANRLSRAKAYKEAATLYSVQIHRRPSPALRYNFGTALLNMGNAAAGEALSAAAALAPDGEVRLRALDNLGLWHLGQAASVLGQAPAKAHTLAAIKLFRQALRLRPGYGDASWNLTIALRFLASIEKGDYEKGGAAMAGKGERELTPADQSRKPPEDRDQEFRTGPADGEGETAARIALGSPLPEEEAARILATSQRDPRPMMTRLMASAGRSLRERIGEK